MLYALDLKGPVKVGLEVGKKGISAREKTV